MNFKQSPGDVQQDSCSEKFHEIKKTARRGLHLRWGTGKFPETSGQFH